jgi:hypothetical protein
MINKHMAEYKGKQQLSSQVRAIQCDGQVKKKKKKKNWLGSGNS